MNPVDAAAHAQAAAAALAAVAARADWPRVCGTPTGTAVLRAEAEDFEVEEIPKLLPAGEGAHWWLWVEKRGANTGWAADRLARAHGCRPRDVGYAGMKDRHALTRQWFSLPARGDTEPAWADWDIEGVRVLDAARHPRKLQRGALAGNRFRIVLRALEADLPDLEARLSRVTERGFPNYFGEQRFGHAGGNVERGAAALLGRARLDRRTRSICLSAVRSALFNAVLGARVEAGTWDRLVPGEVAMLDGSHSVFASPEFDAVLEQRCAAFDVHPTGPMPGEGGMSPQGRAGDLEVAVLHAYGPLVDALAGNRMAADRRALRVRPAGLRWAIGGPELELRFELPAGAYATSLLRELVRVEGGRHILSGPP